MTSPESDPRPVSSPRRVESGPLSAPLAWAKAIASGARDTAKDMLEAGRKGADSGYAEGWRRFDKKTKYRRKPDPNAPPPRRRREE